MRLCTDLSGMITAVADFCLSGDANQLIYPWICPLKKLRFYQDFISVPIVFMNLASFVLCRRMLSVMIWVLNEPFIVQSANCTLGVLPISSINFCLQVLLNSMDEDDGQAASNPNTTDTVSLPKQLPDPQPVVEVIQTEDLISRSEWK